MSQFFVNRPIVAMVIAIITVIVGLVSMAGLPVAQYPNIVPPQIQVLATYVGADALTVEESVATPIEQQVNGVDNMEYMYSVNANNGQMTLNVFFGVETDATTDQILTQMRQGQAVAQLPSAVSNFGVTVQKSSSAPLVLFALYSPTGEFDATFLANYAYININNELGRIAGISQVQIFGAGQYAMRIWVRPDQLAKLDVTTDEIISAVRAQNRVNPAGKVGAPPIPPGQEFAYTVITQGYLTTVEEFGNIIVRANPDGSTLLLKDVAKIDLGAQNYNLQGRFDGKPAAVVACYQLPGSNALDAAEGAKKLMRDLSGRFPPGLEYVESLDTTKAVTAGIEEIVKTLFEAMLLVIIVVFIFLQGWRATMIPLLAVPVSLIGTFALFPMVGFSINTLSLFGLVLAIGLVVDDAIVVVEAVEHHIEQGMTPRDATLKAMREVSGPVVAIALVLSSVFIPTIFIPGITGSLYQQFAVTIAISVCISAFNALTLSPALAALILRPKGESRGPLGAFYAWFNRMFGRATDNYVRICGAAIRKIVLSFGFLGIMAGLALFFGDKLPPSFLPEEDQGYFYAGVQLPDASSFERTSDVCREIEKIMMATPGVEYVTTIVGFNLLSQVQTTYNGFFFVTLKPWDERTTPETQYDVIMRRINAQLMALPGGVAFAFSPPAIPGVGTSGGVNFILQDRSGSTVEFLAENTKTFMEAAAKRPELERINTTLLPSVPQIRLDVDREMAMTQGVPIDSAYNTLQTFLGGTMVNYFNRFGLQWQVYVQASSEFRNVIEKAGQFFVRNRNGASVPLSALITTEQRFGPEFTMRFNMYRSAQINANAAPGFSSMQAMQALEEVFAQTMPKEMGYNYLGMSFQEKQAAEGVSPVVIFALALVFVFLILAAQYESWSLPFSVLLGTPIAVFGAFFALWGRSMENNVYAQIGLIMLIGLAAKNAILIVEFCKSEYEGGKNLYDAALAGARVRLRPILMTAFAFILGCVPLWMATGSGAISRQTMGTAVIGGMLAATLFAIFIIPVTFYAVEKLSGSKPGAAPEPAPETEKPNDTPA
ncbi:MAG: multidrug efflux RND transporter permease subunit [Chthoniobacterales bacterium]|nr:multidrug efflux RND transporter permease subunit [Chthoniobacterales bacterium]